MKDKLNRWLRQVPPWLLYVIGGFYPAWLLWQGLSGDLGPDPVKVMEHSLGKLGFQILIATLCITPLRRYAGVNLLRFRRALGVLAFFYILCHLLVWLILDVQILAEIWGDIIKRPYITIGMAGFALMIPLALTSNDFSVRRLGRRWNMLHKASYVVALLGAAHYVMLVKGFQYEPLIYLGAVIFLLILRRKPMPRTTRA